MQNLPRITLLLTTSVLNPYILLHVKIILTTISHLPIILEQAGLSEPAIKQLHKQSQCLQLSTKNELEQIFPHQGNAMAMAPPVSGMWPAKYFLQK